MTRFAPALALLLAACGGGGDEPAPAVSSNPPASTPAPAPAASPPPAAPAPAPAPIAAPVPAPQPAPIAAPSPAPAPVPDPAAFPVTSGVTQLTCRQTATSVNSFFDETFAALFRIKGGELQMMPAGAADWRPAADPLQEGWPGWKPYQMAEPASPGDRDWFYRYGGSPYGPVIRTNSSDQVVFYALGFDRGGTRCVL